MRLLSLLPFAEHATQTVFLILSFLKLLRLFCIRFLRGCLKCLHFQEKAKKLFLLLYICIPVFMIFWLANNGKEMDVLSFFNKCYGKHHNAFLIDTSSLNVLKRSFCGVQDALDDSSFYGRVVIVWQRLSCIASTTSMLIMGSNLTEGIIYFQLFRYMTR